MDALHIDDQGIFHSGHPAFPECVEALSIRHILNTLGPATVAVFPPSCAAEMCGLQPFSSMKIPVYQTSSESSAAPVSGVRRTLRAAGL